MALDHATKSLVCGLHCELSTRWCELCDYNHYDRDSKEVDQATLRTFEQLHSDAAGYAAHCQRFERYQTARP